MELLVFTGAFWGILIGHMFGIARMVLDFAFPAPHCGEPDTRPAIVANLHYTYFSQLLIIFTAIVIVVISLLTKPQGDAQVGRTNLLLYQHAL